MEPSHSVCSSSMPHHKSLFHRKNFYLPMQGLPYGNLWEKKKWGKEGGEFLPLWLLSDSHAQIWKLTSSKETSISQSLPTPSQATDCLLKTLAYSYSNLETNIHFLVLSPGNQHLNIVLCNISNSQSDFSKSKNFFLIIPTSLVFPAFLLLQPWFL